MEERRFSAALWPGKTRALALQVVIRTEETTTGLKGLQSLRPDAGLKGRSSTLMWRSSNLFQFRCRAGNTHRNFQSACVV